MGKTVLQNTNNRVNNAKPKNDKLHQKLSTGGGRLITSNAPSRSYPGEVWSFGRLLAMRGQFDGKMSKEEYAYYKGFKQYYGLKPSDLHYIVSTVLKRGGAYEGHEKSYLQLVKDIKEYAKTQSQVEKRDKKHAESFAQHMKKEAEKQPKTDKKVNIFKEVRNQPLALQGVYDYSTLVKGGLSHSEIIKVAQERSYISMVLQNRGNDSKVVKKDPETGATIVGNKRLKLNCKSPAEFCKNNNDREREWGATFDAKTGKIIEYSKGNDSSVSNSALMNGYPIIHIHTHPTADGRPTGGFFSRRDVQTWDTNMKTVAVVDNGRNIVHVVKIVDKEKFKKNRREIDWALLKDSVNPEVVRKKSVDVLKQKLPKKTFDKVMGVNGTFSNDKESLKGRELLNKIYSQIRFEMRQEAREKSFSKITSKVGVEYSQIPVRSIKNSDFGIVSKVESTYSSKTIGGSKKNEKGTKSGGKPQKTTKSTKKQKTPSKGKTARRKKTAKSTGKVKKTEKSRGFTKISKMSNSAIAKEITAIRAQIKKAGGRLNVPVALRQRLTHLEVEALGRNMPDKYW